MAWLGAEAYDFKENGLYYNIIDRGSKTCAVTQGTESYSGEVSVPEEANGYKVGIFSKYSTGCLPMS